MMRRALQYQRLAGGVLALHEEDPALGGRRRDARGRRSARCSASPASRACRSRRWSPATARSPATRRADPHPAPLRNGSIEAVAAAKAAGVQVTCEASPHHLTLTDEDVAQARHAHEDEPAAAHRGRPPGAHRRRCATGRSTASPPTTPRTRATRRRCRSSRRRWAPPAWRPRSPRCTPSSCCRRAAQLGLVVERMSAGGDPVRRPDGRGSRPASPRTSRSSTSTPSGSWGRAATRAGRRTAASPAASCSGRVLLTVAAGAVAYRERAFALTAA